jgi:hypothetical protein
VTPLPIRPNDDDTPPDDDGSFDDGPLSDTIVDILGDHGGLRAMLPSGSAASASDAAVRFKIRLAGSAGTRDGASFLIEKRYGWRGLPVSPKISAPGEITLVASDATRALATISVAFDGPSGLAADALYREEIDALRARGARLCEFTRLAVDPGPQSRELLAMLFHIAYMYAQRMRDCTDLLIEVHPRHERYYERMLGFVRAGPQRPCARVGGAPAVLLWLSLDHARREIALHGGERAHGGPMRSLYPLFFSPHDENGIVARLQAIG